MSNQDFQNRGPQSSRADSGLAQRTTRAATDAFAAVSDAAGEAANRTKQVASDTASTLGDHVKQALNGQVGNGADLVQHLASSARRAAEELDNQAPQLAGFVHTFANRVDGYAGDLRGQSVDELIGSASDFTRRQPAVVFGLAALAGFLALRTLKLTQPVASSPSIQPSYGDHQG
jgi:hypothetical protein